MRGSHQIKHWSSTQEGGTFKGTTEALGIQSVGRDVGLSTTLSVHTDSAAVGICKRAGIGQVRHLAVGQQRVQDGLRRGDFRVSKVQRDANPADALSKHLSREGSLGQARCGLVVEEAGRAAPRAQLQMELTV